MNQVKIGKFIAECRKAKNLTQMQLAEKLDITDKAISKWERGIAMPDTSLMLDLCAILGITVNELLSGEKIMKKNQQNQQILLEMAKELERKNKSIWLSMWLILAVSIISFIIACLIAKFFITDETWALIAIIGALILFLSPCFYALKLELSVGAYKCKHCASEFVPTYAQAFNAMHLGTTRYLKCPKCNKRSWCKKVINNN